jgi:ABC-type sugar transport system ATPase subunit
MVSVTAENAGSAPLLVARGLGKRYAHHPVLRDVDFTIQPGESVAVIGENGAGKSTFVKILAGVIHPDEGEILLDGKRVFFHSPREAINAGVAFIPQELAYVPDLTVAENIVIGQWPNAAGLTSPRAIRARAEEEVRRFGLAVDVRRRMGTLKLADRQLVEILKALSRRARIILLDEPTASLTDAESHVLFRVLHDLCQSGVGVVYISHRMDEVFRFSDRVDVLRSGALVASTATREARPAQLIAAMLGQAAETFEAATGSVSGDVALALEDWSSPDAPRLQDVNLAVHAGETVGLFGIRGSGADVIAEGLAGRARGVTGSIRLGARSFRVFRNPREARRAGVAYVPPERKRDGLVLAFPIRQNLTMLIYRTLARLGVIRRGRELAVAARLIERFDIRCRSAQQLVGHLSGGNQQKVLLASRLVDEPRVVVLNEPTRGVDVGARLEIHRFLRDIAGRGAAVLLVTSDIEEAVAVSDRLLIVRDGAIRGELAGSRKTQGAALRLATGTEE